MSVEQLFRHCFSAMGLKVTLTIPKNIGQLSVHTINTHYFELLAYKLCNQITSKIPNSYNCNELLLNFIFRTYFLMRAAPSKRKKTHILIANSLCTFIHFFLGLCYTAPKPNPDCYFRPISMFWF
jgi:hypothetical protein